MLLLRLQKQNSAISMKINLPVLLLLFGLFSCQKVADNKLTTQHEISDFIVAVDISRYPEIALTQPIFYDLNGKQSDFLSILKENGINTIRLRLWVNPIDEHSGFSEVTQFCQNLRAKGFKTWLSLHYSDTWADPGKQTTPLQWQGIPFEALEDSVYNYTKKVIQTIQPDYVQIGNEINSGILHPYGEINRNKQNFISLLQKACVAVRENTSECKIILHYAGFENADWFFEQLRTINYDYIGLSYYPIWHGKSLHNLKSKMQQVSNTYGKKILIAETAYPFTLAWNDWTNNIVGSTDQLILPEYPASAEGQKKFVQQIKTLTKEVGNGFGFCYWGAELISWKGNQATNASPWENQALFDFDNKALPVLGAFKNE